MSFVALNLPSTQILLRSSPSQWPNGAELRCKFGEIVLWIDYCNGGSQGGGRHLNAEHLERYRYCGDAPVDRILDALEKDGEPLHAGEDLILLAQACFENAKSKSIEDKSVHDPLKFNRLKRQCSASTQIRLAEFYESYYRTPDWANLNEIRQGQEVFLAYLPVIGISLFYRSLVPGFSIPKIAAVLFATRYLTPPTSRERVFERLEDTGAMLAICCQRGIRDLLGGGDGWRSVLQVRVLHAKVRRKLMKRRHSPFSNLNSNSTSSSSSSSFLSWNLALHGVPINQEDMAVTLLAFSVNSLLGCEMVLRFPLPLQERLAFMAFWRYIGWLIGIPTIHDDDSLHNDNEYNNQGQPPLCPLDPCGPGWLFEKPDVVQHSYAIFQSIVFHILDPDDTSRAIAHHLLRLGRPRPSNDDGTGTKQKEIGNRPNALPAVSVGHDHWYYFRCLQCRRFAGQPLADALHLPLHPVWYRRWFLWICSEAYLLVLRLYTYAALPKSPFRGFIVKYHKRTMESFIVRWRSKKSNASSCPFAMSTSMIE